MSARFGPIVRHLVGLALACHALAVGPVRAEETQTAPPNYEQHVRPIFQAHCGTCHNLQKQRGGLALDDYARVMEGGASGEVIVPKDLDGSRLWQLVSHADEPTMPPDQDRIDDEKLDVIRQWIVGGAIRKAGDKAKTSPSAWVYQPLPAGQRVAILPEHVCCQPVTYVERPAGVSAVACSPVSPLVAIAAPHQIVLYHLADARLPGRLAIPYRYAGSHPIQS